MSGQYRRMVTDTFVLWKVYNFHGNELRAVRHYILRKNSQFIKVYYLKNNIIRNYQGCLNRLVLFENLRNGYTFLPPSFIFENFDSISPKIFCVVITCCTEYEKLHFLKKGTCCLRIYVYKPLKSVGNARAWNRLWIWSNCEYNQRKKGGRWL